MHDTGPPRIPVPGDAPCADASITAPTDDSTDALHTAAADVPEGILNDSVDVSTTVVGGMDETEGLREGVTEGDTLDVTVTLADNVGEDNAVDDSDVVGDDATLLLTELLNEGEAPTDALTLDDTLDDGDVE